MQQPKTAIITGASRGIGKAIALQLAREGWNLAICAREEKALDRAVADIQSLGVQAIGVPADITDRVQLSQFIQTAAQKLETIDALVCNAGGIFGGGILEATIADWQQTFDLNFFHCVAAIQTCVPLMKRGGSIVLISSISGKKPSPRAQYGCAKAAQLYLAKTLAHELAPFNVRVNAISPGSTFFSGSGWDKFQQANPDTFADFQERDFPAKRLATPEEIAEVAAFLLSDRASWINGADIPVDGAQLRPSARGY